jgi:hypothetical protein
MAITRITTGENSLPQARSGIGDVVNSSRSVEVARKSVTEGTGQIPVILYVVCECHFNPMPVQTRR